MVVHTEFHPRAACENLILTPLPIGMENGANQEAPLATISYSQRRHRSKTLFLFHNRFEGKMKKTALVVWINTLRLHNCQKPCNYCGPMDFRNRALASKGVGVSNKEDERTFWLM